MESDYHWLITVGLVTSSVIAVAANSFLLVVFCRRRGLRTVPNRFVINLLITNLLSSVLLIPLLLVDQETPSALSPPPNETAAFDDVVIESSPGPDIELVGGAAVLPQPLLCRLAQSATSFVCTASIFSILLIGVNQYFGVIHSLRYHAHINRCRSSVLIGASWALALLCAVLSALVHRDGGLWRACGARRPPGDLARALSTAYALGYFFLVILAPFVAICAIYVCIYAAAHQSSERMRRSASAPLHVDYAPVPAPAVGQAKARDALPKVHSAPDLFGVEGAAGERGLIGQLRHKLSNASVFRYREETRAAKISVLVVLLVLVCYIPYGAALVLGPSGRLFDCLSLALLAFSNVLSPFLFGYRNKRVKREICRMLGTGAPGRPQEAFGRVPQVVVAACRPEGERKSILKRVCESSGWSAYKKCDFIAVPDGCIGGEARGSFSSASTQLSTEE